METRKILVIVVLALGLMVWTVEVSEAAPMGTAWTYQGRLMDSNSPADGLYDFQFLLYAGSTSLLPITSPIDLNDVDVIDGYFTVELDFGSNAFTGDARWLQIEVRPGELNDPNVYTILEPRQEITPTPYALQTRGIFVDEAGKVGIGTTTPEQKLTVVDGTIKCTNSSSGGWAVHGEASGWYGEGVYGYGTGYGGRGVYGKAGEDLGMGVYGKAIAEGQVTNYGGYFSAAGDWGLGVYGTATATGSVTNTGGFFSAAGDSGTGVYGRCDDGKGVYGVSTNGYAGYFTGGKNYFEGNVGIGTTEPEATLDVTNSGGKPAIEASSSWIGVKGTHSSTSGSFPGVWGATDSLASGANGVRGVVNSTSPGSGSSGVRGINNGTNNNGAGVLGSHAGGGNGLQGTSVSGNAVLGQSDSGYGVYGVSQSNIGVIGVSLSGTKPAGAFFGGVCIGTYTIPTGVSLAVVGKILCEEVEVQLSGDWPDYVFEQDYELMPLEKLGQYVREKKHLPDMTTADEVGSSGISLGQAQTQMLRKIEELTLYVVDLNQQLSNVRQENKSLQNRITALERK